MQLTTQATIHVINWSPCRPSAPGSIFTPGCSAVASSGITIVLGYGGPHGPPYGTWRPIRIENPDCVLVEIGLFYKDAIRIGSSVRLTENIFSTKPTEDGPKKFIKFWPNLLHHYEFFSHFVSLFSQFDEIELRNAFYWKRSRGLLRASPHVVFWTKFVHFECEPRLARFAFKMNKFCSVFDIRRCSKLVDCWFTPGCVINGT